MNNLSIVNGNNISIKFDAGENNQIYTINRDEFTFLDDEKDEIKLIEMPSVVTIPKLHLTVNLQFVFINIISKTIQNLITDNIEDVESNYCGLIYFGNLESITTFLRLIRKNEEMLWWDSLYSNINANKFNIHFTCANDPDIVSKYISKVNLSNIALTLTEEVFYILQHHNMEFNAFIWIKLCSNTNLSEEFFEQHLYELIPHSISKNTNLSEEFFERHPELINWPSLCRNTNIGEKFFRRNIKYIHWLSLCTNPSLSEKFFSQCLKYINTINSYNLSSNTKLTEKFFEKHLDIVNWPKLCTNINLSEEFLMKYSDKINWGCLSYNTNYDDKFFERYIERVNWDALCQNTGNISEKFFDKYSNKINWYYLCANTNISEEFFEKYIELVEWDRLCTNTNLSEEFFLKHIDKIDWWNLTMNSNISAEFILNNCNDTMCIWNIYPDFEVSKRNITKYSFDNEWKNLV